ncbi:hypothetical protein JAO76_00430 [Pontibacter sp. BT310]|uniref:Uncharacterized protein n=1 Tax=Pontibacter populi TaxID=890055 RepID=A0ABS6X680_9BACT|nr:MULTISPECIES: hypothetical protein [Pontibacter]MBJ6116640.1 hypothetical protein [Pontibacter sp. BT310]MBR0569064.1 hypothetical protein [Microvirga sp. STS03]MBW3363494.1 hypothetical protein [Pontibacter populi]
MNVKSLLSLIDDVSVSCELSRLETKFGLIKLGLDYLEDNKPFSEEALELFVRIHQFGYELGYNKATETYASDFHKPLVKQGVEILKRKPSTDIRALRLLKDALVYEYNQENKRELEIEIHRIEALNN